MLAVHFLGKGKISLADAPTPEPRDREVLVKVMAAAICGTDRENLEKDGQKTIPGHENAGVVAAVDKPSYVQIGQRVAINCHVTCGHCEHCLNGDLYFCKELQAIGFERDGGFAEYALIPEPCCTPIPDDISFDMGALIVDMLGTPFRAVKRAALCPGDHVGIWGAGPIGLSAMMVASRFGAKVAVVDLIPRRLDMAKAFGADLVVKAGAGEETKTLLDWTEGRGIDVVFDCVGNENVAHQALAAVKKRGKLVIVGVSHSLTLNPWEDLICREITTFGTRNFNTREFDEMVGLVRAGLPIDKIVTHHFPLADAQSAFATFRESQCGKIIITGG